MQLWDNNGGKWNDKARTDTYCHIIQYEPVKEWVIPIPETQTDYRYEWISIPHTVSDKRLTVQFQWTSNTHDVYDRRERFETGPVDRQEIRTRTITKWQSQPLLEPQTELVSTRLPSNQPLPFAAYGGEALRSVGTLTVDAGQDIRVSGRASGAGGASFLASRDILVNGQVPAGTDPAAILPAPAELASETLLTLTAGRVLTLGENGVLRAADPGSANAAKIVVRGPSITLSGNIEAEDSVTVTADNNVMLDGPIDAGNRLEAAAGEGT